METDQVEFRILGPLEVVDGGRRLPLRGARVRELLTLLLTHANEVVSIERLIDSLWEERPPSAAANALQYHVSRLRKALAAEGVIVTEGTGYSIRVAPAQLDALRFEELLEAGRVGTPDEQASVLRAALALWRGPALGDVAHLSFAQPEIRRLEELKLTALEGRIEADLALGRHRELVGELEALVQEHPLRETFRAQLMQALYRSGRQADALAVFRNARELLVGELGLEPSATLQNLERAILRHDPLLASDDAHGASAARSIVLVADDEEGFDALLSVAEPLAGRAGRELLLARFLAQAGELAVANADLARRRATLGERGVRSRIAVFTTASSGAETVLLGSRDDVDLVLLDARHALDADGGLDDEARTVLDGAPCDVALLVGSGSDSSGPVVTPFGGVEHDWSAIELAAWLAQAFGTTLRLLGTEADAGRGRRDASRLLARASLLVQQAIGIVTEPVLVTPGDQGVLEAAHEARLLVIGLSDRWREEGIGSVRLAVAAGAVVPTLFVRRGLRSSGVAPSDPLTRFTWTLAGRPRSRPGPSA